MHPRVSCEQRKRRVLIVYVSRMAGVGWEPVVGGQASCHSFSVVKILKMPSNLMAICVQEG